jgi:hypothetical protein
MLSAAEMRRREQEERQARQRAAAQAKLDAAVQLPDDVNARQLAARLGDRRPSPSQTHVEHLRNSRTAWAFKALLCFHLLFFRPVQLLNRADQEINRI